MAIEERSLGMRCIKYLLCLTNLLFVLSALFIISIGSMIFSVYTDFETFLQDGYFSPAVFIIVIGFIIFFISLFGFLGAVKESTCMMMTFTAMMSIIVILELSASIAAFSYETGIYQATEMTILTSIDEYKNNNKEIIKEVDFMQINLKCCGSRNASDWGGQYPESCCPYPNQTPLPELTSSNSKCEPYEAGCLSRIVFIVQQGSFMIGTGAITMIVIQLMGMALSYTLAKSIRKAKTEREMRRTEIRNQVINGPTIAYTELTRGDVKSPVLYSASSTDA